MKRTKFETMLAFNRDTRLFPELDNFYAFIDFLKYFNLTFEDVVNNPHKFDYAIERYEDYTGIDDIVEHFNYCVSYYDNMGRTAETFARAFYLDNDYCTDNIDELSEEEKLALDQRVKEALEHTYYETHIFESGEFIFYVGLC